MIPTRCRSFYQHKTMFLQMFILLYLYRNNGETNIYARTKQLLMRAHCSKIANTCMILYICSRADVVFNRPELNMMRDRSGTNTAVYSF